MDDDKRIQNNVTKVVCGGVRVCFSLACKLCSPVVILLVGLRSVYKFHLGKEADMMQEKFLSAMGGGEPGEHTLGLAA